MSLHEKLDFHYGSAGDAWLRKRIADGADLSQRHGPLEETLLHVATRRRRRNAVAILVEAGAAVDARTAGGKTAYTHAMRRGFDDVARALRAAGADVSLAPADAFAVAVKHRRLDDARKLLAQYPAVARTSNPEEDRLLADVAGGDAADAVQLLIEAGADLDAPGLDGGTPLHQACWFGRPENASLLIAAGARLDLRDDTHGSTPLGWVAHGSRFSGKADRRPDVYAALATLLLNAIVDFDKETRGNETPAHAIARLADNASDAVADILRACAHNLARPPTTDPTP